MNYEGHTFDPLQEELLEATRLREAVTEPYGLEQLSAQRGERFKNRPLALKTKEYD